MLDAPALEFSAHSQVRYVEHFLDKEAVTQARRLSRSEAVVLAALRNAFEDDLRRFRHVVQVANFNLLHKTGSFASKVGYYLNIGTLSVYIEGNRCLTTVNRHRSSPRPSLSLDEDPDRWTDEEQTAEDAD